MKYGLFILFLLLAPSTFAKSADPLFLQSFTAKPLGTSSPMTIEKLKGHVVLIDFWASWCNSCKEAIPYYNKLSQKWAGKKFIFIGINEDDQAAAREDFLKQVPVQFSIYHDADQAMSKTLGIDSLPHLLVLDKNLKIVASLSGFKKENEAKIEEKITALLK